MKTHAFAVTAALLLPGVAGLAHAQTQTQTQTQTQALKMRPGLWEHSVVMKSQSGQMEAAMAQMQKSLENIPPAQRKQMQDMLTQQGVGLGAGSTTVKVCITPEQAAMGHIPPQEGCTQTMQRTGAGSVAVSFSCPGGSGRPPTTGEGTMTLSGPTAYIGQFKVKTALQGRPEQIDMAQTGQWLSADCGAIKPMPQR